MKATWGLYDGLEALSGSNLSGNENSLKRDSEAAGLASRPSNQVKKPNFLAPRVARMAQRGIKQPDPLKVAPKAQIKPKTTNEPDGTEASMTGVDVLLFNNAYVTKALSEIKDPYDPGKPNDYLECCELRNRKQQELERQRELEDERQSHQQHQLPQQQPQPQQPQPTKVESNKAAYGMTSLSPVAEQIMKKMGWKGKGHGLGKNQQGMASALVAQKTGAGAQGIIVNAEGAKKAQQPAATSNQVNPSNVVVLRNMVGPGEVDAMLTTETAQECGKYGKVIACEAIEIKKVPPEDAVRIFVKFETTDQALQALIDLDGRFFGGRTVRADYYPKDKFDRKDYHSKIEISTTKGREFETGTT